ncbi:hypothetical protein D3C71_2033580 [compost metagenome]
MDPGAADGLVKGNAVQLQGEHIVVMHRNLLRHIHVIRIVGKPDRCPDSPHPQRIHHLYGQLHSLQNQHQLRSHLIHQLQNGAEGR